MRRPCYVVDSFAAHPLSGNPAGVLLDGAELDGKAMQRIANELKHSETAFPLPAREPTAALHLRWFTPEAEVAFCGHATLAAFHVLVEEARRIRVPDGAVTRTAFTCKSGRLNVELSRAQGKLRILVETPESRFEPARVPAELITALGVAISSRGTRAGSNRLSGVSTRMRSFPCARESSTLSRPLLQVKAVRVTAPSGTRMRRASSTRTWNAASVACPQKATSASGVNQRRCSAAVGSRVGSGNAVSLCFSSLAIRCIAFPSSST